MNITTLVARHSIIVVLVLTKFKTLYSLAAAAALCMLTSTAVAQPTQASFQGIGALSGHTQSEANAVSGDGATVVGASFTVPSSKQAIRWTLGGGGVSLGFVSGASDRSHATGASFDGGVIVGNVTAPEQFAFRWTTGGGMQSVDFGGDGEADTASGVSNAGDVMAGTRRNSNGDLEAVRWTAGGALGLGGLLSGESFGWGISGNGAVLVGAAPDLPWEAFRWSAGLGMLGLGTGPAGFGTWGHDASLDGSVIVGLVIVTEFGKDVEAMRWTASTGAVSLGDLPGGNTIGIAWAVSADGSVVVGTGSGIDGQRAFIWTQPQGMRDLKTVLTSDLGLNLTGWTLQDARGISADGRVIVGAGINPQGVAEGWVAVLSDADTDGDGLLDDWEINGIPYVDSNNATQRYILNDDGDPQSDSLPNHKDIWVEIDAMVGRAPTDADLQRVKDAFALAPAPLVNNPNSQAGVRLHAIIDETNLPLFAFPNSFTQFDQVKLTQQSSPATTINGRFGTVAERTGPDALAKREAKRKAFRYCIFADTHSGGLSSGSSELPGNDFMVTLGGWPIALTGVYKAGAFMHELGHTLGLGHGGRDAVTGADHDVYKPNYYSIMNYTWQMPEQWMDPNTWPLAPGRFGYSTFALLDLNEADLFECQGVGAPVGVFNSCSVPHNTHNSTFLSVAAFTSYMCCAIDWNNDGHVGCFIDAVAVDVNHLYNNHAASPGEVLRGREDWSKLIYDFRTSPDFADGVHLTAALVQEITFEEHQAVLASLPAFCLGDINLDRSVNVDDLLAVITAWGATGNNVADLNGDGTVNVDDLLAVITNWGPCPR